MRKESNKDRAIFSVAEGAPFSETRLATIIINFTYGAQMVLKHNQADGTTSQVLSTSFPSITYVFFYFSLINLRIMI